jgi:acyl-CoA dehydrogenase
MQETTFSDALKQLLHDKCTPAIVRVIEADPTGQAQQSTWHAIEASGFADALRSESNGGAALTLSDVFPLLMLCGQYALPLPLAETLLARAWLDQNQALVHSVPKGSIALANGILQNNGELSANSVASGQLCDWVFVCVQGSDAYSLLLPQSAATTTKSAFPTDANLIWPAQFVSKQHRLAAFDAKLSLACVFAAQLAGALMAVFDRTLQFANDRHQFGKPIGKFQAIQHQLSVMAEHVFAARMAAQIGCHSNNITPDLHRVAIAKARTSEAALEVAGLSHSIHGAIGFTAEFDLQLLTRRLHLWRQAAGSESYWHSVLGEALVNKSGLALDLIRSTTDIN